jgi:hypothetical protein
MALQLTIDQKALIELKFTDRAGNPAAIDGTPTWETSNEDFASVEPAEDGLSAYVVAGEDADEVAVVTVRADADLGDGVAEIIGTLEVQITSGTAQFVELTAGAPEPKA